MAEIKFASGSTTTTRSDRARTRMNPDPKISLVPTEKSWRNTDPGRTLLRITGSRKLWWLEEMMYGPWEGRFSSPVTCNLNRSSAKSRTTQLSMSQKISVTGRRAARARASGSTGSFCSTACQPANCSRDDAAVPDAALSRTRSTNSRTV